MTMSRARVLRGLWAAPVAPLASEPRTKWEPGSRPLAPTIAALPKRPRGSSLTLGFARPEGGPLSRALWRLCDRALPHARTELARGRPHRRRELIGLSFCSGLLLVGGLATAGAASAVPVERHAPAAALYVAPDAAPGGNGTAEQPFATIDQAQQPAHRL